MKELIYIFKKFLDLLEYNLIKLIKFMFQIIRNSGKFAILTAFLFLLFFLLNGIFLGLLLLVILVLVNQEMPNLRYKLINFLNRFK